MRLKITKSSKSTRLYAIKSTYDPATRKTSSRVVHKLGTAEEIMEREGLSYDEAIEWARERIAEMSASEAEDNEAASVRLRPTRRIRDNEPRCVNAGFLFPKKLCRELGLRTLFNQLVSEDRLDFDAGEVVESLVSARLIASTQPSGLQRKGEPGFDAYLGAAAPTPSQISRTMQALSEHANKLLTALREAALKRHRVNVSTLYYNSMGFRFSLSGFGEQRLSDVGQNTRARGAGKGTAANALRQNGYASERDASAPGRRGARGNAPGVAGAGAQGVPGDAPELLGDRADFNAVVQAGILLDATGFPLSFDLGLSGKTKSVYLQPQENQLPERFSRSRFVACIDAATSLESGLLLGGFDFFKRDFTVEHNVQSMRPNVRAWIADPSGWRLAGSDVMMDLREADAATYANAFFYKERWYDAEGQLPQRYFALFSPKKRRAAMAERMMAGTQDAFNSGKSGAISMGVSPVTEQSYDTKSLILPVDTMRYDGITCFVTTLDSTPASLIEKARHRWRCADRFRLVNWKIHALTDLPGNVDCLRACFLLSYMSLVVYSLMRERLELPQSDETLLTTLHGMNMVHLPGEGYLPAYDRTQLTDALHTAFNLRTDTEIVTNRQLRAMLSGLSGT